MTLHLKDRAMEQKLNELSNGEFSKILNETSDMKDPNCICFTIDKKKDIELSVYLLPEAIEPEYDPHAWNEYPKVKPPKHEPLRVEFADKSGTKAFFDDCLREYVTAKRIDSPCRYRPWED